MTAPALPPFEIARTRRTLFRALVEARSRFGGKRPIMVDGDGRTLTYDDLVRGALALGHALKRDTHRHETIGVLLPTGVGSVITVYALTAYGRTSPRR